jgi:hypothetical protein
LNLISFEMEKTRKVKLEYTYLKGDICIYQGEYLLPITNLGKQREALTGSTEFYKKKLIEYLEVSRGLIPKMDSFIEGILADCILSDKNGKTEYWLEAKATTVSLGEADFIAELAKYLSAYLSKSLQNRFKMIIAVQDYRKKEYFRKIYQELDEPTLEKLVEFLIEQADENSKKIIKKANFSDIKRFFEDTEIIRATSQKLQDAIDQRRPKPPLRPRLPDAKYAVDVLDRYKKNEPLNEEDFLVSNLFQLRLPKEIFVSETPFNTERDFFRLTPEIMPPPIRIVGKKAYSFFDINPQTPLGIALKVQSTEKAKIGKWDDRKDNRNIILFLLHRWIEDLCNEKGLSFDQRTERYFFSDEYPRKYPKTMHWKSQRTNVRDVITPVKREDGTVYYYAHRAVQILIRSLWGEYFVQLIPGRVFTGDCYTPYPSSISDKLDRAYRKSNFTRNKNQLNDVLFWSKILFSEKGAMIKNFAKLEKRHQVIIPIIEQVGVSANRKPNAIESDTDEEDEEITTSQVLDSFLEESEGD